MSGLVDQLSPESLEKLRRGYSEAELWSVARQSVERHHQSMSAYLDWLGDAVYRSADLPLQTREHCLVALLSAKQSEMPLAVHMYWSLMTGTTPEQIMGILSLVAAYSGIDSFTLSARTASLTFEALEDCAAGDQVGSAQVLAHLVDRFGPSAR